MQEILKLQQKLVPEFLELLEKRYNILRTIYYDQPIGRRVLANNLGIGERIVRTEINFLKKQNLIKISTPGMTITNEGEEVIDKLKEFIHEIKGLSQIEDFIKEKLKIQNLIIVPGDLEEDKIVLNEIGRAAAKYICSLIRKNSIIAITGGSTIKEVVDNVPKLSDFKNVLVVPARGGIGRNVETQANTLAASLANKIGANYKLLHLPDNLSDNVLSSIINEDGIKEVLENIQNADLLIYGIGRADEMARRRGVSLPTLNNHVDTTPVGEAFGYYFNSVGEVVYSTTISGIKNDDMKKIKNQVAVAGGKSKAKAIVAAEMNNFNSVLITDEGAAREIAKLLS
ncbi:MAG: sugar-binding transcriptional regulator [Clostridiaceae bacterium]|nr:sugar-binding transcriptional regulator [Clostridiaceae bacterium]